MAATLVLLAHLSIGEEPLTLLPTWFVVATGASAALHSSAVLDWIECCVLALFLRFGIDPGKTYADQVLSFVLGSLLLYWVQASLVAAVVGSLVSSTFSALVQRVFGVKLTARNALGRRASP